MNIIDELDENYIPVDYESWTPFPTLRKSKSKGRLAISPKLKQHLIDVRGIFCEDCMSETFDNVHHRDGNSRNNEPYNLLLLCYKCHVSRHKKIGDMI
jgi:5-methylcytosine-specific restriction endonuclease McrA